MNSCAERRFELLKEVRDICRAENIDCWLYGPVSLDAYRKGTFTDAASETGELCIHADDVETFIRAASKKKKRAAECLYNNPAYPSYDINYCDTETLDFRRNTFRNYDNNCLHVKVRILSTVPGSVFKRAAAHLSKELNEKVNSVSASRCLFRMRTKALSGNAAKLHIGKNRFPSGLFSSSRTVSVCGEEFQMPENAEKYLRLQFGDGWKYESIKEYVQDSGKIRSHIHSWKELRNAFGDAAFAEYCGNSDKLETLDREYMKLHSKALHCYALLTRTHDRFTLWQKYMPQKRELMKLWEEGDTDTLREKLKPYLDALEKNRKSGLGLCFDMEIFGIVTGMLEREGNGKYAKALEALVPEAHRQSIIVKNLDGSVLNE